MIQNHLAKLRGSNKTACYSATVCCVVLFIHQLDNDNTFVIETHITSPGGWFDLVLDNQVRDTVYLCESGPTTELQRDRLGERVITLTSITVTPKTFEMSIVDRRPPSMINKISDLGGYLSIIISLNSLGLLMLALRAKVLIGKVGYNIPSASVAVPDDWEIFI